MYRNVQQLVRLSINPNRRISNIFFKKFSQGNKWIFHYYLWLLLLLLRILQGWPTLWDVAHAIANPFCNEKYSIKMEYGLHMAPAKCQQTKNACIYATYLRRFKWKHVFSKASMALEAPGPADASNIAPKKHCQSGRTISIILIRGRQPETRP